MDKRIEKEFHSISLRPSNMTFYSPRSAILASVRRESVGFYGDVLDVGCGFMPYKELVESSPAVKRYVGMDLEESGQYNAVEAQLKWDGRQIPAGDQSFDCVMATELLEHCGEPERVLKEILRVMRPGGFFFATVPFIWNLHEIPFDEYRYTPYSLERHLENAGFSEIEIKPLGGWNMSFAQMIGLWLGFSPMHRLTRAIMRLLLFPLYIFLIKTDRSYTGFDGADRSMFSGLSVTARR